MISLLPGRRARQGGRARIAQPSGDLAADVLTALLALQDVPPTVGEADFRDIAQGRLGRICGPGSAKPDARVFQLAVLNAVAGRRAS